MIDSPSIVVADKNACCCCAMWACLSGAIASVVVHAAWLRWSASLGSTPRLAGSLRQVIAAYALRLKFSGRHRGFDGVVFNLWLLANAGFRDTQY